MKFLCLIATALVLPISSFRNAPYRHICPAKSTTRWVDLGASSTAAATGATAVDKDLSWTSSMEDGLQINGVKLENVMPENIRGVVAKTDISGDTPLVVVSANNVLEVNNKRPPTPFPEFVTQEIWEKSLWFQRLAFQLLFEMKIDIGNNSNKKDWFQQLPSSFSTPIHWSDKDIEAMQYPALQNKVTLQRDEWRAFYDSWQKQGGSGNIAASSMVTYDEFVWAMECMNSRAFSGTYEGSSAKERSALLLFTGVLTILWPLLDLGTYEQSISAALVVGMSILARDVIFSKVGTLKRYVVCPVVDMFNHQSNSPADVSYNYFANQFELRAGRNYRAGQQVFISYGKQSNDRLLQYYGFVEENNPYDSYDFGCGFLELMLKYADLITAGGGVQQVVGDTTAAAAGLLPCPIPSRPGLSAEDRLKAIAVALQNTRVDESTLTGVKARNSVKVGTDIACRYFRTAPAKTIAQEEQAAAANKNKKGGQNSNEQVKAILEQGSGSGSGSSGSSIVEKFDDVTVRAMRALYCSPQEWDSRVMTATGTGNSGSKPTLESLGAPACAETEALVARALRALAAAELNGKATTLEEDTTQLQEEVEVTQRLLPVDNGAQQQGGGGDGGSRSSSSSNGETGKSKGFGVNSSSSSATAADPSGLYGRSTKASILAFRVQKKLLLREAIETE
mmetsp:Transcript_31311/g.52361  ORF Transcript_31311/g.52361 Transcript_31311/m.52361 type:complete len:678 (+) Transcript_31311:58-2091(+)